MYAKLQGIKDCERVEERTTPHLEDGESEVKKVFGFTERAVRCETKS
jgi:hypothetical protein